MLPDDDGRLGLYLHVPFCERVCPYCDFAVVAARVLDPAREDRYVDALLRELESERQRFEGRRLTTLYFGGGTPSLLRVESVARLIEAAERAFPPEGEVERSLEVNPSTLERERLPGFRAAGINRLSVGIQSFDDLILKRLGRAHRSDEGRRTLAATREAGFSNVSVDLLFAGPDSTPEILERDLAEVVRFAPEHVSAYELTLEPGTPFAGAAERGRLSLPAEEAAVAMHERVVEGLADAGIEPYEISSYARAGYQSRHNRRYWRRQPVLGLGVGAWSSDPASDGAPHGIRRANPRDLDGYLERVESDRPAAESLEILRTETARGEAIFLGLRRTEGLRADTFAQEFGARPRNFFAAEIAELVAAGLLLEGDGGDLRLSARGRLLSDSVFERFVEDDRDP